MLSAAFSNIGIPGTATASRSWAATIASAAAADLSWVVSSACTAGNCVSVAAVEGGVLVRDSKNPDAVLSYTSEEWNDFLRGVTSGDFESLSA